MKVEEKGCFVHMIQNSKYISPGSKINKKVQQKIANKKIPLIVFGAQKNGLIETLLLNTHNIILG